MKWYEKADLKLLFGDGVDLLAFRTQCKDGGASIRGGTLMAPPGPLNPPGPTPLAPRPGSPGFPKPIPKKRVRPRSGHRRNK